MQESVKEEGAECMLFCVHVEAGYFDNIVILIN